MPSRKPRSESTTPTSLPGVMEARRRRRRRGAGSRRRRRRSSTRDTQQEEVRSQSSGASSRSSSVEPDQAPSGPSRRSCHLGNVNPYINFVSSSKGLYAGRPFKSMSKDLAARWRSLPESEREPFIVQARRSQAEIAKSAAGRLVGWRLRPRRYAPGRYRRRQCHRRVARTPTGVRCHNYRVELPGRLCRRQRPVQNYRSYCKLLLIPIFYFAIVLLLVIACAFFFFWVPRDWLFSRKRRHFGKVHHVEDELDS